MGQALYRTYRSRNLAEVVGQEHITTALSNALKNDTIAHAYLFTGPKGVGKTSIARILAHEINHVPYDDDSIDLDIIEIDAASNRRIDEIRDLRDKVHIAPAHGKFKVYIIDEVHMLTREAFNALLKTLEEPPAHVVFILATTEAHKLPETIISRTQHYSFKPASHDKLTAHLRHIAEQEHISIADDALELIAQHSDASFRNGVGLLDQLRNAGSSVTLEDVQTHLGVAPSEMINALMQQLGDHNASAVVETLAEVQSRGSEPTQIARQLGQALRDALLAGRAPLERAPLMQLLGTLLDVPAAHDPRVLLELSVISAALAGQSSTPATLPHVPADATSAPSTSSTSSPKKPHTPRAAKSSSKPAEPDTESTPAKTMPQDVGPKPPVQIEPHPSSFMRKQAETTTSSESGPKTHEIVADASEDPTAAAEAATESTHDTASSATLSSESWQLVLNALKQTHVTLANALKAAATSFAPGTITVEVANKFLQKRVDSQANKHAIVDAITRITGEQITVRCVIAEPQPASDSALPPLPPEDGEVVHAVAGSPSRNGSTPADSSAVQVAASAQQPRPSTAEPASASARPATSAIQPSPANAVISPAAEASATQPEPAQAPALISSIFGSAELLQS